MDLMEARVTRIKIAITAIAMSEIAKRRSTFFHISGHPAHWKFELETNPVSH